MKRELEKEKIKPKPLTPYFKGFLVGWFSLYLLMKALGKI